MFARRCLAAALLLIFAAASARAEDPVEIRYKVGKDDRLIYRKSMSMTQEQQVAGQKIETTMSQTDVSVYTLQEATDDGNFRIQSENEQLKVSFKVGPLGEYKFDSTSSERDRGGLLSESLNPLYDKLSGAVLTIVVSPTGEVVKTEGYKELIGDLLKDNPVAAQFAGGGSEEAFKASSGDTFIALSDKPVQPGDTWEDETSIDLGQIGKVEGKTVFKFEGWETVDGRKLAKISEAPEFSVDIDIDMGQAQVSGKVSVEKGTGTALFDTERGHLVSHDSTLTMSGNLTINAGGMNLPVTLTQTVTSKAELLDELPKP